MKIVTKLSALIVIGSVVWMSSCSKSEIACSDQVDCSTVTYSATIAPLVATKCALSGCHIGSFDTYDGLKAVADNGRLSDQVVTSTNMPEDGIDMSCEERALIECWINSGAPNN